jgi:hypothetical protein
VQELSGTSALALLSSLPDEDGGNERRARGVAMLTDAVAQGRPLPGAARKLLTAREQARGRIAPCVTILLAVCNVSHH